MEKDKIDFLQRKVWLALMGFVLIGSCLILIMTQERKMAAVKELERNGGYVEFIHYGPQWLAKRLGNSYPCESVEFIELGMKATDEDLSMIGPLKQAKMLFLNGTEVSGPGLTNLLNWPRLEEIYLTKSRISDQGMQYLVFLQKTKMLTLRQTKITDEGAAYLEKLKALQELDLQDTMVTDHCLKYLIGLPLKEINIRGTLVSSNGIAFLKKNIPAADITQ